MAARYGQKLKLLYLVDILSKRTDEEHPMSANEICDALSAVGVTAERKAIYDDIAKLIDFGYDIIKTKIPKNGYFLASRDFELPEIYLLSDAVRSASFISAKKTRELIGKLDGMLSIHQAKRREKGIFFDGTGKCDNEEIFYTIDSISRAIENKKKIEFKYSVRVIEKGNDIKTKTNERKISPYAMTWQGDHYYLIGNYEKYDNLIHLRIDRMRSVKETDENVRPFSEVCEYKDVFDVADYTKKLFSMFGGELDDIEFRCDKEIIEQIADRFSNGLFIRNVTDTHFTVTVKAAVSEALVTWIMNYNNKIEVLSPDNLREMISKRAQDILDVYKN